MLWTEQITMTPDYLIDNSLAFLKEKGIETNRFELKLLLAAALEIEPSSLPFYTADVNETAAKKFEKMVTRRAEGCPVDKIIGLKGFYKYDFVVNENVLSPRPETEIMVEKALVLLKNIPSPRLLEFGIGSGCILLSVLKELLQSRGIGIDVSTKALTVATQNAERLDVQNRLELKNISWFDAAADKLGDDSFDIIFSNPPYIPSAEIPLLDKEVRSFDPMVALDGGADGLKDYGRLSALAAKLLKKGGFLLFEIGEGQADDVISQAQQQGLSIYERVKDLAQTERCIILKK